MSKSVDNGVLVLCSIIFEKLKLYAILLVPMVVTFVGDFVQAVTFAGDAGILSPGSIK